MTILLDTQASRRELDAIVEFMLAVGHAQASYLHESLSFASAEGESVFANDGRLRLDVERARGGRGDHGLSWIYERLIQLDASDATVRTDVVRSILRGRATGATRPDWEGHAFAGREYRYLPGPVSDVDVIAARYGLRPQDGGGFVLSRRSSLEVGETLVHELVVHAWRDVSFYQPPPGYPSADRGTESRHRAFGHAGLANRGTAHNVADAESDLIEMYLAIELARRNEIGNPGAGHRQYARIAGGVMGTRVVRWQAQAESRRRHAAELLQERIRFLEQRVRFEQTVRRLRRRDQRAR